MALDLGTLGSAHATLPLWVLVASTALSSLVAAVGAFLLGRLRPASTPRTWLLRSAAGLWALFSFRFMGLLAHLYLYVTSPRLRVYHVFICFGEPHWNIAFGVLIPPLIAVAAFLVARRLQRPASGFSSAGTAAGA